MPPKTKADQKAEQKPNKMRKQKKEPGESAPRQPASFGVRHAQPQSPLLTFVPESALVQVLSQLSICDQHKVVVHVCKELRRLVLLASSMPKLVDMSLVFCGGGKHGVTKLFVAIKALLASRGLATGTDAIKALKIGNHQFGKTSFKKLLQLCPHLEELCCPSTKKVGISGFADMTVTAAPHLRSFKWGWAYDSPEHSFVDNLIAGRTKLEVLEIDHWEGMMSQGGFCGATDRLILALSKSCPNLRELKIHGAIHVSLEAAAALSAACPNLTAVTLNHDPLFSYFAPDGRKFRGSSDRDMGVSMMTGLPLVTRQEHAPFVAAAQARMLGRE